MTQADRCRSSIEDKLDSSQLHYKFSMLTVCETRIDGASLQLQIRLQADYCHSTSEWWLRLD